MILKEVFKPGTTDCKERLLGVAGGVGGGKDAKWWSNKNKNWA